MLTTLYREGRAKWLQYYIGGEGSLGTPKSDYVICARPLKRIPVVTIYYASRNVIRYPGDGRHVLPEEAERHPWQQDLPLRLDRPEEDAAAPTQVQTEQIVFSPQYSYFSYHVYICFSALPLLNKAAVYNISFRKSLFFNQSKNVCPPLWNVRTHNGLFIIIEQLVALLNIISQVSPWEYHLTILQCSASCSQILSWPRIMFSKGVFYDFSTVVINPL